MIWQFASALNIGDRDEQQDRVAIFHKDDSDAHLLVVADGMGGHENGAAAAQTVIDVASKWFDQGQMSDPRVLLEGICLDAHKEISSLAGDRSAAPGSTCVIAYLKDDHVHCAYVGDSRLYQFRGGRLRYKTSDHSIAQLVKDHGAHLDGGQSSAPRNQLYMCLGGANEITPEYCAMEVEAGDFFLLCSDGLWGQVDVEEAFSMSDKSVIDQEYAERLVQMASNQGQGNSDNVCLAWAYCQDDDMKAQRFGFMKRISGWFA